MYEYDQWMKKATIVSIDPEVELHVLQSTYVCFKKSLWRLYYQCCVQRGGNLFGVMGVEW